MDTDLARQRLAEERERLTGVRSTFDDEHLEDETESESSSELSSYDQHQADMGTETFEREKDLSILEQVEAELADVEHALRRLDEGTYGTCEIDGEPIPEDRLEAMPAARLCLEHQAEAEREVRSAGERPDSGLLPADGDRALLAADGDRGLLPADGDRGPEQAPGLE
jgi:RNA polymerase-binding transcription factor DksA